MTIRLSLWAPVALYMAALFALSSIPNPPAPPQALSFVTDKPVHAMLYAGLAALVVRALAGGWRRSFTVETGVLAVIVATAYGVFDEFHQYFVPPRQMDAADVVADFVGAAIAATALYLFVRARRAESTPGSKR